MITRTLCIAGLLASALAACGEMASEPATAPTGPAAAAPAASAPAAAGTIILDGEGLRISTAAPALIAFGAPIGEVEAAVKSAIGGEPEYDANPDCPNGPVTYARWEALNLVARDGLFIGWETTSPTGPGSSSGVKVGTTRTEATSKGAEISTQDGFDQMTVAVDGVYGFLNEGGTAVYSLVGGDTCIAS